MASLSVYRGNRFTKQSMIAMVFLEIPKWILSPFQQDMRHSTVTYTGFYEGHWNRGLFGEWFQTLHSQQEDHNHCLGDPTSAKLMLPGELARLLTVKLLSHLLLPLPLLLGGFHRRQLSRCPTNRGRLFYFFCRHGLVCHCLLRHCLRISGAVKSLLHPSGTKDQT